MTMRDTPRPSCRDNENLPFEFAAGAAGGSEAGAGFDGSGAASGAGAMSVALVTAVDCITGGGPAFAWTMGGGGSKGSGGSGFASGARSTTAGGAAAAVMGADGRTA